MSWPRMFILQIKAVAELIPAHYTQFLSYLRMSQTRVGLLLNVHRIRLMKALRQFIV